MAAVRTWEKWPVIGAGMEDLDDLHLRRHFRRRLPDRAPPDDWRETLIAHKLAVEVEGRILPTCVGILLLAEQPEQFLPGAYVDLALYTHDEPDGDAADRKRFSGPVPEQIEQAVSWLRASPLNPVASVKDGGGRVEAAPNVRAAEPSPPCGTSGRKCARRLRRQNNGDRR